MLHAELTLGLAVRKFPRLASPVAQVEVHLVLHHVHGVLDTLRRNAGQARDAVAVEEPAHIAATRHSSRVRFGAAPRAAPAAAVAMTSSGSTTSSSATAHWSGTLPIGDTYLTRAEARPKGCPLKAASSQESSEKAGRSIKY